MPGKTSFQAEQRLDDWTIADDPRAQARADRARDERRDEPSTPAALNDAYAHEADAAAGPFRESVFRRESRLPAGADAPADEDDLARSIAW